MSCPRNVTGRQTNCYPFRERAVQANRRKWSQRRSKTFARCSYQQLTLSEKDLQPDVATTRKIIHLLTKSQPISAHPSHAWFDLRQFGAREPQKSDFGHGIVNSLKNQRPSADSPLIRGYHTDVLIPLGWFTPRSSGVCELRGAGHLSDTGSGVRLAFPLAIDWNPLPYNSSRMPNGRRGQGVIMVR